MTVLLGIERLSPVLAAEARAACKTLGLPTVDWVAGIPRVTPVALISALRPNERRIPQDMFALLEATPALRLVLCSHDPLVKPRVVVGGGRVTLLSAPIDSALLSAALRPAIHIDPPAPIDVPRDGHFEVLRRTHWVAWSRGRAGPPISLHEQAGATVVIGETSRDRSTIESVMLSSQNDEQRESTLRDLLGTAGVAHLTPEANQWVIYWPGQQHALWMCSRNRLPARWNAARALEQATRRLVRMYAFPDDQLVAAWSETDTTTEALDPIERTVIQGGADTIVGLSKITDRVASMTGLVMEVR